MAENWVKPVFPITGYDVKKLGLQKGPDIGNLLKAIEGWWIDQYFAPDRAKCLKQLEIVAKKEFLNEL